MYNTAYAFGVRVGFRLPQNELICRKRSTWGKGTGETKFKAICSWASGQAYHERALASVARHFALVAVTIS